MVAMAKTIDPVKFSATLLRPAGPDQGAEWSFLKLPIDSSQKLPTRSQISVEGTFNGFPFYATLDPDGEGGHWLKVEPELLKASKTNLGETIELVIAPMAIEPEPKVPEDVQTALESAPAIAMETWLGTTAIARRDWIKWITSGKKAETRTKRIEVAISKMSAGSKRPCCFDRSGMYDKSLSCPLAEDDE